LRLDGSGSPTRTGLFARCAPYRALATHDSITALRRLLEKGRWFAPLAQFWTSRVFAAMASPDNALARR